MGMRCTQQAYLYSRAALPRVEWLAYGGGGHELGDAPLVGAFAPPTATVMVSPPLGSYRAST